MSSMQESGPFASNVAAHWETFFRTTDESGRVTGYPIALEPSDFAHCDVRWALNESGDKLIVEEAAITKCDVQNAYSDLQGVYSAVHARVKVAIVGTLSHVTEGW